MEKHRSLDQTRSVLLGLWCAACGADSTVTTETETETGTSDASTTGDAPTTTEPDATTGPDTCAAGDCGESTTETGDTTMSVEPTTTDDSTGTTSATTASETGVDACAPNPCENGGSCVDEGAGYTCECASGYAGDNCEVNVDDCAQSPCENGGACVDGVGEYTCECASGYEGDNCETLVIDCVPDPCQNGGVCVDEGAGYTCECASGYEGDNCEVNIDDCAGAPCQNGGVCVDEVNDYSCECASGYEGDDCEVNVDDCAQSPCENGGACVDGVDEYTCECASGYEGDNCETNTDDCAQSPCENGGACVDGVDGYVCECAADYTGLNCEACVGTLADCNGDPGDGCEVNLQSDPDHCDTCGNACPANNICSNAACQAPPMGQMPGVPIDFPAAHGPLAPAVADVNGDGKLDILVANAESGSAQTPSGSLSVFLGKGDATVHPEVNYAGAPMASNAVVAADVDGDGWVDAVTVDGQTNLPANNGNLSVYRNLAPAAPGTFAAPTTFTTGAPGSLHLCAGDFNGDGEIDVATTSVVTNQVSVIPGTGAGGFGAPTLVAIVATGGVQSTIACRDLNGDGAPDIAVTSPSSARLSILVNQGNGTFAAPVAYTNAVNGQTAGIAFGDADADGKLDILANGAAGAYIFFFKGNADGTFANGVQSATGAAAVANSALGVVSGDFNGDGKLDAYILATAMSGGVRPMTGNGNGTFTAGAFVPTGSSPGLNAIAVADLDVDGYNDLILTNKGTPSLTVVPNGL